MPFAPSDLASCVLYADPTSGYYSDAGVTVVTADGAVVQRWVNRQSGTALNQDGASGIRPTIATIDGFRCLHFAAGSAQYMSVPNVFAGATEGSVYGVFKKLADPPVSVGASGLWHFGSQGSGEHFPYTDGQIYDGTLSSSRYTVGDLRFSLASWKTYGCRSKSNHWITYWDGIDQLDTRSNSFGATTTPTIGKDAGSDYLDGYLAVVLGFNSFLTESQHSDVVTWLNDFVPANPLTFGAGPAVAGGLVDSTPFASPTGLTRRTSGHLWP